MRILTVRQPWAGAILHDGKNVENRVRNIAGAYRGPVAIHAGLSYDMDAVLTPPPLYAPIAVDEDGRHLRPIGAIIGVVDLVDVHWAQGHRGCYHEADVLGWVPWDGQEPTITPAGEVIRPRFCSPWGDPHGPREDRIAHLVLEHPRPLVEPIPFRGALGLRELDPATTARVLEALAA